jgi:hypothetical protein
MRRQNRATSRPKLKVILVWATWVALMMVPGRAGAQSDRESQAELTTSLQPLRPGALESQLFSAVEAHNEMRKSALRDYIAFRTYQVIDLNGNVHAREIGRMEYRAPDKKTFIVTSEDGSGLVRRMALNPVISSEIEAAAGKEPHDSAISPSNYSLDLLGEQQVGPYHCFVAREIPKRRDKYLFEGKLWIDVNDYAVVRIEGHPARKLSFWIERADFVRQYQKIDGFWLPKKDETFVQVRLYGEKVLTIEHQNYVVNGTENREASNPSQIPQAQSVVTAN